MNLDIGYVPKVHYEKEPTNGGIGCFFNEGMQHVVNIGNMFYTDYTEQQLAAFIESLAPFPLYFLIDHSVKDFNEEFKGLLVNAHLPFEMLHVTKKRSYILITVANHEELLQFIPIMLLQQNWHDRTLWANRKDAFTVEWVTWNRFIKNGKYASIEETICFHFDKPTTIFWFGFDFTGTTFFTNESRFASIEVIQHLLPSFIQTDIIEYG